jgi:hypothetical protein
MAGAGGLNSSVLGDSPSVSPGPNGAGQADLSNSPGKNKNQLASHRHKRYLLAWFYVEPMSEEGTSPGGKTMKKQFSKLENPFRQSQNTMPWLKSHKQSQANLHRVAMVEAER